jgi:hypothetical protein
VRNRRYASADDERKRCEALEKVTLLLLQDSQMLVLCLEKVLGLAGGREERIALAVRLVPRIRPS